jgi:hypothetical protein
MSRDLRRSDPHLAAMLVIFARLTAGEAITSEEQSTSPGARAWRGLAWLGWATVHVAAALIACAGRILRRAAGECAAARRRLGTVARTVPGISSPAHPPLRRSGPGLPAN